jgi:cellulose 1,4-beta-cellobiosidase
MKLTYTALAACAAGALAAPSTSDHLKNARQSAQACSSAVTLDAKTNVFTKYTLHPNTFYRKEVEAAAAAITDSTLKAAAAKVADVGSFLWL